MHLLLPALAVLGWQGYATARAGAAGAADGYRLSSAALALGLVVWWLLRGRHRRALLGERLLVAATAAGTFWLAALELLLSQTLLLALGFLVLVAAASVHAVLVLALSRPATGNSRAAKLAIRVGFSLSVFAVLIAAAEGVLRAVFPLAVYEIVPDDPTAEPCLLPTRQGRLQARPDFRGRYIHPEFPGLRVDTNAWGLRDGLDEARPPDPGEASVLVLGDSFAFGTGVTLEQTFQEQLEAHNADITPAVLRVYGAGMPGYGPLDERQLLAELADQTRPRVVITAVFEGNDFTDNLVAEHRADLRQQARAARARSTFGARVPILPRRQEGRHLAIHSPPLQRFLAGIRGIRFWMGSSALVETTHYWAEPLLVGLGLTRPIVPSNHFLDHMMLRDPPWAVRYGRMRSMRQLADLRRQCRYLHAELVLLLIPAAIQADPARFQEFLSLRKPGTQKLFDRTLFHRTFLQALRRDKQRVVDMLPVLQGEAAAGRSCYHREGHWNARAHRLAAKQLIPVLRRLLQNKR